MENHNQNTAYNTLTMKEWYNNFKCGLENNIEIEVRRPTRSPFVTLLFRRAQSGRWSYFGSPNHI